MKAKMSTASLLDTLSDLQKKAVVVYVDKLWEQKQKVISNRFLLAMCLAANDILRCGDKKLGYLIKGVEDILSAYAEDSYTPSEARHGHLDNGDYDEMAAKMQRELNSRPRIKTKIIDIEEEKE